jgi:hypothetical protein
MRILIGMVICVIVSMITSFFFPGFNPESGTVSTLYTISGIMFSIGMSLIITSNTSGVKNIRIRDGIRRELCVVRNHFIWYFAIASFLFVFLYSGVEKKECFLIYGSFILKYSHLLVFTTAYTITFLILNFLAIQRLNIQIEDALDKSESN